MYTIVNILHALRICSRFQIQSKIGGNLVAFSKLKLNELQLQIK